MDLQQALSEREKTLALARRKLGELVRNEHLSLYIPQNPFQMTVPPDPSTLHESRHDYSYIILESMRIYYIVW
jgi:hypothetical protein